MVDVKPWDPERLAAFAVSVADNARLQKSRAIVVRPRSERHKSLLTNPRVNFPRAPAGRTALSARCENVPILELDSGVFGFHETVTQFTLQCEDGSFNSAYGAGGALLRELVHVCGPLIVLVRAKGAPRGVSVEGAEYLVYCVFIPAAFMTGVDGLFEKTGVVCTDMKTFASILRDNNGTRPQDKNKRGHRTRGGMRLSGKHKKQYSKRGKPSLLSYAEKRAAPATLVAQEACVAAVAKLERDLVPGATASRKLMFREGGSNPETLMYPGRPELLINAMSATGGYSCDAHVDAQAGPETILFINRGDAPGWGFPVPPAGVCLALDCDPVGCLVVIPGRVPHGTAPLAGNASHTSIGSAFICKTGTMNARSRPEAPAAAAAAAAVAAPRFSVAAAKRKRQEEEEEEEEEEEVEEEEEEGAPRTDVDAMKHETNAEAPRTDVDAMKDETNEEVPRTADG